MKLFSRNKRERTYNMKTYKVGLIRVLTTGDEELLQLHGKLIESYFPMFQVVSRCIPDQPEGIHDDETFAVGVPKVVNCGRKAVRLLLSAVPVTREFRRQDRLYRFRL